MKREQTAVEWLIDEIEKIPFQSPDVTDYYNDVISLFTQAKAMEKEQIVKAVESPRSRLIRVGDCGQVLLRYIDGEQYYKETYVNEKNND